MERPTLPFTNRLNEMMARATVFTLGRPHYDSSPSLDSADDAQFYAILDRLQEEGDVDAQKMLYAIRDRTSSRPDDEVVIIAVSLGIDTLPVLQAPPENRMIALMKSMPTVPANVLFTAGPRTHEEGFRWAPTSFLRANGAVPGQPISDLVPMTLEDLESRSLTVRLMSKLDAEGRGLVTFNPAIGIRNISTASGSFMVEMLGRPLEFALTDEDYNRESTHSERMQAVLEMLRGGKKLAILVPDFDPTHRLHNGVLVEVLSEIKPFREQGGYGGTIRTPFIGTGSFYLQGEAEYLRMKEEGTLDEAANEADWTTPRMWLVD